MTAYTWIGGTGDWNVAANWSPAGGPPTATDTATINATGAAYTVTIDTADVAQSLTERSASATVDDTGSLTLSRTFTLSAGTFILGLRGKLWGGTTKVAGGTFACDGGTLIGVTYDGTLDLSGANASVHLAEGTVVNNASGTSAGTINDTGANSTLYFDKTQTFNNATINLGSTSGGGSVLTEYDSTGAGTVLTLGAGVTIDESGAADIETGRHTGDGIVNQGNISQTAGDAYLLVAGNSLTNSGTITAGSSGGAMTIEPGAFTNSGTLAVSNADAVTIEPTSFSNAATGVIAVGANSTLTLAPGGSWSNQGSITLASGSSLYLGGAFALAGLGNLTNSGGRVYIEGTFDNTGGTLDGTTALGQAVLYGGTIEGGTVTPSGLVLSSNGTLSGVTYDGTLDLSGEETSVHLASGTAVNNAAGTGAGTINDTGAYSTLYFDNTQTFNNATINLGSTSGESLLEEYDLTGLGAVLTLGSGVTIDQSGYAYIETGGNAGDGIVNQGTISQAASGGALVIAGNSFTNDRTITAASSGGALTIAATTFIDNGAIDISNGETVTIDSTTANTGTIDVSSGALDFGGGISGTGSETISGPATLKFDANVSAGQTVTFTGSGGELILKEAQDFHALIKGFGAGGAHDSIDAMNFPHGSSTFSFSENSAHTLATLTLTDGADVAHFHLSGDYVRSDFKVGRDIAGTLIKFA
jgi:hypothetical protein